jgi:hypothetical protein
VPLAGGRLLAGLRLAPDEDQPVVEPDDPAIDRALQAFGDLDGLVAVPLLRGSLGLAVGVVVHGFRPVP